MIARTHLLKLKSFIETITMKLVLYVNKTEYGCKWTWETFQLHDWTQIEVEQLTQLTVEILIKEW